MASQINRKLAVNKFLSKFLADADESDDEPVFEPVHPDMNGLGPIGGATTMASHNLIKLIFSFFRAVLKVQALKAVSG